jgi:hypothetical protein
MIKGVSEPLRRFRNEISVECFALPRFRLARSRIVWLFCVIQVVAIAADAPLTAPSTPANAVMRFASTMLTSGWFRY